MLIHIDSTGIFIKDCSDSCFAPGSKTQLLAIPYSDTVNGIRPYIVGGIGHEPCELAGDTTCNCTIDDITIVQGRIRHSAPTNATFKHTIIYVVNRDVINEQTKDIVRHTVDCYIFCTCGNSIAVLLPFRIRDILFSN